MYTENGSNALKMFHSSLALFKSPSSKTVQTSAGYIRRFRETWTTLEDCEDVQERASRLKDSAVSSKILTASSSFWFALYRILKIVFTKESNTKEDLRDIGKYDSCPTFQWQKIKNKQFILLQTRRKMATFHLSSTKLHFKFCISVSGYYLHDRYKVGSSRWKNMIFKMLSLYRPRQAPRTPSGWGSQRP